jgi:hypothetical protein
MGQRCVIGSGILDDPAIDRSCGRGTGEEVTTMKRPYEWQ